MEKYQILAISGSLRADSTNTNILKHIRKSAEDKIDLHIFAGLAKLPHFNPATSENTAVTGFKSQILKADGVIICTPEYAFGIPGVLKNALDWTVATGEFNEKPVVAISASPLNSGGDKALASLLLTLTALGTIKDENSFLSIPNIKQKVSVDGLVTDLFLHQQLMVITDNLIQKIKKKRSLPD